MLLLTKELYSYNKLYIRRYLLELFSTNPKGNEIILSLASKIRPRSSSLTIFFLIIEGLSSAK